MVESHQVILVNDSALGKARLCVRLGCLTRRSQKTGSMGTGDHWLVTECAWLTIELDGHAEAISTRQVLRDCLES